MIRYPMVLDAVSSLRVDEKTWAVRLCLRPFFVSWEVPNSTSRPAVEFPGGGEVDPVFTVTREFSEAARSRAQLFQA